MSNVIHRSIARVAARNAWRSGKTEDSQLLEEALATDRFACTDAEMLTLLRAELARVQGQSEGGHRSAIRRKFSIKTPQENTVISALVV